MHKKRRTSFPHLEERRHRLAGRRRITGERAAGNIRVDLQILEALHAQQALRNGSRALYAEVVVRYDESFHAIDSLLGKKAKKKQKHF